MFERCTQMQGKLDREVERRTTIAFTEVESSKEEKYEEFSENKI